MSQCVVGHFTSNGICTKKNCRKRVPLILESGAENYFNLFVTDIGIYFLNLANGEEMKEMSIVKRHLSGLKKHI